MITRAVNIARGVRCDVYIGRRMPNVVPAGTPGEDGRFGNPFRAQGEGPFERMDAIAAFRTWLLKRICVDPNFRADVLNLKGKVLGCWCAPDECHGDVYAELLEGTWTCTCTRDGVVGALHAVNWHGVHRCSRCWRVPGADFLGHRAAEDWGALQRPGAVVITRHDEIDMSKLAEAYRRAKKDQDE